MTLAERSFTTDDAKYRIRLNWNKSADGKTEHCVVSLVRVEEDGSRTKVMRQFQDRAQAARAYLHPVSTFAIVAT